MDKLQRVFTHTRELTVNDQLNDLLPKRLRLHARFDRKLLGKLSSGAWTCMKSVSRLVKVTESGQVIYKAEKQSCRAFPAPDGDGIVSAPKRNFQILSPLDFLAEFTQHIPPQGAHLIRYYGYYVEQWIMWRWALLSIDFRGVGAIVQSFCYT